MGSPRCTAADKRQYGTAEDAGRAAATFASHYGRDYEPYLDQQCGHWHLRDTAKRKAKDIARLNARNADPAIKAAKRKRWRANRRRRDKRTPE
ncbi:hypothetical protein [Verrucosispora sp. WMMC514]|uniref:hypothetical protein n=1 Tax=Verrucosispora sp. WMMC514 TaxID=3015156 RepID=UPI00248CD2BA|nr:hypothetical protein [Verrucosispora sp. WMMC514]WBB94106.1 hypothetical protein O7597_14600 [Verrucosispora sp. WMMC514]